MLFRSNKTLTSPTINSPTITNATISADTLTGYTTSNSGTIYGVPVTTGSINASYLTASSITNTQVAAAGLYTSKVYNPYKFSVYRNTTQTVTASAYTKIQFNAKTFDTGNNFDITTNFQFTAPIAGFYYFSLIASPSASSTNTVVLGINVNSFSSTPTYYTSYSPGNGQSLVYSFSKFIQLNIGDTVSAYGYNQTTSMYVPLIFDGYLVSAT